MKVLTVKQPWAHLIIHGGKNIENRKWKTKFRGRILIHSAKISDKAAMIRCCSGNNYFVNEDHLIFGAIIGSVEIVDCVNNSTSKWFEGPYGFVLEDPRPEKIEFIKGKLSLWNYEQTKGNQ